MPGILSRGYRGRALRQRLRRQHGIGAGVQRRSRIGAGGVIALAGYEHFAGGYDLGPLGVPAAPPLTAPHSWISLPRIGASVPRSVKIGGATAAVANIAEILLAEGVLQDRDWNGGLAESVTDGLRRWINLELGAEQLRHLDLAGYWTDDITHAVNGFEVISEWVESEGGTEGEPVGAFFLLANGYSQVFVGAAVTELNHTRRNLGYHVLAAVNHALWTTVGGATPAWAAEELERFAEWRDDTEEEAEENGWVTARSFYREIPTRACAYQPKLRSLKDACRELPAGWAWNLASQALQLEQLVASRSPFNTGDETRCFNDEVEQVLPLAVRWSQQDDIARLWDDHHELIAQSGWETDLVWTKGFQRSNPGRVRQAARALGCVVEILVRADRLIQALHSEEPIQPRVRVGAPLIEVFAGEGAAMEVHSALSTGYEPELARAILLYQVPGSQRQHLPTGHTGPAIALATLNPVVDGEIGAGRNLTREQLADILRGLSGQSLVRSIPPAHVLFADSSRVLWYRPAARRPIFFSTGKKDFDQAMRNQQALYPALLFMSVPSNLYVWALGSDQRPEASSPLYRAPFLNIYDGGHMCAGTTKLPLEVNTDVALFEKAFFETTFTHSNVDRRELSAHRKGHDGMWLELIDPKIETFPEKWLRPLTGKQKGSLTVGEVLNQ